MLVAAIITGHGGCEFQVRTAERPPPLHAAKMGRKFIFACILGTGPQVRKNDLAATVKAH